jgi:hypothetical protein
MNPLSRRLDRLELTASAADAPVTIWVEPDETPQDALVSRYAAGPYPARTTFIGWARTAEQGTPDPSNARLP